MALVRAFPNQFTGQANAVTTSTDSAFDFGFVANYVRVVNDKAARIYVQFSTGSSGYGTTGGVRTCAAEAWDVTGIAVSGVALASTTTTTGTTVSVYALGY